MFSARNKGFEIEFDNGVTVSIQFGAGNYCSNRHTDSIDELSIPSLSCANAEIAIWNLDQEDILQEYIEEYNLNITNNVIGYATPTDLLQVLTWAEQYVY